MKKHKIWIFPALITTLFLNYCYGKPSSNCSTEDATITTIQTAIKNHQITCEQLIELYLNRIKNDDLSTNSKPPINAINEINTSVLDQARALDRRYNDTHALAGPLHCIPVLLKDNIDSFDSTTTTGSYALLGNQPVKDAFLVAKLRAAGAIILGHGSMDEFANGMYGISSRNGRTGNAFDTSKSPGGSSSGEAAAVAANFVVAGIGTDNSGSVRIPAAFNGIVGLRPSTGLISQQGIFPMGNLDGTAGPMTRTVEELAIILNVIAQSDPHDKKTVTIPRQQNYLTFLNKDGMQHKRIGIVHQVGNIDTFKDMPNDIRQIMQKSFEKMHSLGAATVDEINLPDFDTNRKNNMAGMIEDINAYLTRYPAVRKNFQDICESDRTRTFGNVADCLAFMKSIPGHESKEYSQALAIFEKNKKYVETIMKNNHLDALFIPISRDGIATYDPLRINPWQASISSNAGLPSIVMNIGYKQGMPIGVELIGKKYDEGTLITIAYAYEQHTPPRAIPKMPAGNLTISNFSIPEFNNFINELGKETYTKILQKGKTGEFAREDLTPEIFKEIVNRILKNSAA